MAFCIAATPFGSPGMSVAMCSIRSELSTHGISSLADYVYQARFTQTHVTFDGIEYETNRSIDPQTDRR